MNSSIISARGFIILGMPPDMPPEILSDFFFLRKRDSEIFFFRNFSMGSLKKSYRDLFRNSSRQFSRDFYQRFIEKSFHGFFKNFYQSLDFKTFQKCSQKSLQGFFQKIFPRIIRFFSSEIFSEAPPRIQIFQEVYQRFLKIPPSENLSSWILQEFLSRILFYKILGMPPYIPAGILS